MVVKLCLALLTASALLTFVAPAPAPSSQLRTYPAGDAVSTIRMSPIDCSSLIVRNRLGSPPLLGVDKPLLLESFSL